MSFWAVAQTENQRERTAQRFLEHSGFQTYLPLVKEQQRTAPLFPSYLFVTILDRWHAVENTVGVLQLLRAGDVPARLDDQIVTTIKRKERDGIVRLPKRRGIGLGDRVRIIRGSFADHFGVYDGMLPRDRVIVLLELLGRKVHVEIDNCDLRQA
jgi:transcriptional antiterminator RfaH